jgi:ABC-type amino acid transport substrate-binding protein
LSTQAKAGGQAAVNARDRIGTGPWYGPKGAKIADNVADLHGDTLEIARLGNNLSKATAFTETVKANWDMPGCEGPSGLSMDREHRRVFAVCGNKLMAVMDADSGKLITTVPIGNGPDASAFSPKLNLAFSSNGSDGPLTDRARAQEVDFSQPYAVMYNTYLVRADSSIRKAADVDAKGVRVGTVKGQTQQIYLSSHLKNAEVILTTMPLDELETMMLSGEIDSFGENRQRMEEAATLHPKLRALPDNFSAAEQAIVVRKEDRSSLDEINRFLRDVLASDLVKDSLNRAKLTGVEASRPQIQ